MLEFTEIVEGDLVDHLRGPALYDVVVISRPHNMARFGRAVERFQPHAALVYDAEAVFHHRVEGQVPYAPDAATGARLVEEASSLRRVEQAVRRTRVRVRIRPSVQPNRIS